MSKSKHYHSYLDLDAPGEHLCFDVEVIKELCRESQEVREGVKHEVKAFFIRHWKDFGDPFFDHALFHSRWVLMLRFKGELIAVSTVHKKRLYKKVFYNFKTEALDPKYHFYGIFERINQILFAFAYIDNMIHHHSLYFNMIFTTPNLRVIGNFAKHCNHFYPDPYTFDETTASMALPDAKTWKYVEAYNKVDYPLGMSLSKEACVVDDSESEWPYLCYEQSGPPYHKDKIVNAFGDHYLGYKEGKKRMIVVCAFITPWDVLKYFVQWGVRLVKKRLGMK